MKITYKTWRGNIESADIQDFIAEDLCNSNYDGQIERNRDCISKCAGAIGRLTEVLSRRQTFTANEIEYISGGLNRILRIDGKF